MRASSVGILALAALGISAPVARAQVEAISFPVDRPVRVWRHSVPEVPLTGRIYRWTTDTVNLVHPPGSSVAIPLSDLARMEVERTKGHAGTGALIGGGISGALGLALGIAATDDEFFDADAGDVVVFTAVMAASGAALGALIGLMVRTDGWEKVPLPPRAAATHAE